MSFDARYPGPARAKVHELPTLAGFLSAAKPLLCVISSIIVNFNNYYYYIYLHDCFFGRDHDSLVSRVSVCTKAKWIRLPVYTSWSPHQVITSR